MGTAGVDVVEEPHLFANLQEEWGWVFHSPTIEKKQKSLPVSGVLHF